MLAHKARAAPRSGPQTPAARAPAPHTRAPVVQRDVDPNYVVDQAYRGRAPAGPSRVFFDRNSAVLPAAERTKLEAFKVAPEQTAHVTLLGLATEDELAADPLLPVKRAKAVDQALDVASAAPPHGTHTGLRTITRGTAANTQGNPDLRFNRAVEILRPGEASRSPDTPAGPPSRCDAATEADLQAAKTLALRWIDETRAEVRARPVAGPIAASLDQFFGNHQASTARRVDHNLELIRHQVIRIAKPEHHDCAHPALPGCVGAFAYNDGAGNLTLCAGYRSRSLESRARNLVHEGAHSAPSLRITGSRNAPRSSDFAYRSERLLPLLGGVDPDQALANSDSYGMLLMTRRAPAAVQPGEDLPAPDPAPAGFASRAGADHVARAVALAEVWVRTARFALNDLHAKLRLLGTGAAVPADLDDSRLTLVLGSVKELFPPILSAAAIRGDDLLMIAGVRDRYDEISRLLDRSVATVQAATTSLTVPAAGPLTFAVSAPSLASDDFTLTWTLIDKLVESVGASRISPAMRKAYSKFVIFLRDRHP